MTFLLRHPKDGRVHWSSLKAMADSPAHARLSVERPKAPTTAMVLGSAVDSIVFGQGKVVRLDFDRSSKLYELAEAVASGRSVAIFDGARRGKEWDRFALDCDSSSYIALQSEWEKLPPIDVGTRLVTGAEYELASGAAEAVLRDGVAAPLLVGKHQVVSKWDLHGLPFGAGIEGERGGFDCLGSSFLSDLKVTTSTKPEMWRRQCWRMLYPAQLTLYQHGAKANGWRGGDLYVIGVEARPPHNVTVLTLTQETIDHCELLLHSWCSRVTQCESSGNWPGYVVTPQSLEPLPWQEIDIDGI